MILVPPQWPSQEETGGKVVDIAHYSFVVPSYDTARIQECHITLGHVLCQIIDRLL